MNTDKNSEPRFFLLMRDKDIHLPMSATTLDTEISSINND